jgi:predicted GNAT family N-acyltransferase
MQEADNDGTAILFATSEKASQLLRRLTPLARLKTSGGFARVVGLREAEAAEMLNAVENMSMQGAGELLLVTQTTCVDLIEKALALRHAVFIDEVGRDRTMERDGFDDSGMHVVAVLNGVEVVGTLRYYQRTRTEEMMPCIGRVAVRRDVRGRGVGASMMTAAHWLLTAQGYVACYLHAEATAVGFYEKLGYVRRSDWFQESGKPHVRMEFGLGSLGP